MFLILFFLCLVKEKVKANGNGFVVFEEYETVSYFWWYHLIGLIWSSEFIIACQQLAISGAVAKWYFTRNKESVSCVIGNSVGRMIVYHLGSVATGAVIITIVKLPRWILMYLSKKLKVSDRQCAKYWTKCCICCLWCLEKCLKYLSANAYTIVAISGQNFCTSARKVSYVYYYRNEMKLG
ncbi:hypothetical protein SNE40_018266 [Patella caerulea]|uniref:Choline transporter-like protein n=1 Tax=Patella caerulea TaxID=87958 RepID=A0AAN8J7D5_PATCE